MSQDIADRIADHLLADHIALMAENHALHKQRDELLAALKEIESMSGTVEWWKYQEIARAAITNARGK